MAHASRREREAVARHRTAGAVRVGPAAPVTTSDAVPQRPELRSDPDKPQVGWHGRMADRGRRATLHWLDTYTLWLLSCGSRILGISSGCCWIKRTRDAGYASASVDGRYGRDDWPKARLNLPETNEPLPLFEHSFDAARDDDSFESCELECSGQTADCFSRGVGRGHHVSPHSLAQPPRLFRTHLTRASSVSV